MPTRSTSLLRGLVKSTAAIAAFTLAAIGLQMAAAPPASATDLPDAITNVWITEPEIYWGTVPMRFNVDFSVGAGANVGGSVQAGDTFWVDLDPRLSAENGTFPIYETGSATVVIARVTVEGDRATFTLTDYAADRSSTTGNAYWQVSFRDWETPAGPYTFVFQTQSHEFNDGVRVNHRWDGSNGSPDGAKFGVFDNFDQTHGIWVIDLPRGRIDNAVVVDPGHTKGPLWEFDCESIHRDPKDGREVDFTCGPDGVRWEVEGVTGARGDGPRIYLYFTVTDPSPFRNLVFTNSANYTTNDGTPRELKSELRQNRGGSGSGPTIPLIPTVTQSICDGNAPTAPDIEPAFNGNGVTYALDNPDYGPGDTVHVIAELSSSYTWDSNMPSGWVRESASRATYEIQLDAPNCATEIVPVNPEVVQATCVVGTGILTDPTMTATDTDQIHYEINGDVIAGGTVTVVGTLQDPTADQWNDDLPNGWTINTDGNAERTVTLDLAPCATAITPISPDVVQDACIGDTPSTPKVTRAADGNGITYRIVGTVKSGANVQVIASLEDSATHRWGNALPSGWSLQADGDAVFQIQLDSRECEMGLAVTGPDDYALPLGAAGGILLLGGLVLLAVRSHRRNDVSVRG